MNPDTALSLLDHLATQPSVGSKAALASMTARWIRSESERGRAYEAANDSSIQDILYDARLAMDCGWKRNVSGSSIGSGVCIDSNVRSVFLTIYCDGSCISNGKPGARAGVGVYILQNSDGSSRPYHSYSAALEPDEVQTNQRAELRALHYAFAYIDEHGSTPAEIYTDSAYAIHCITLWGPGWKAAGWKKADKKPILHLDLIQPMLEMWDSIQSHARLHHVRGHSGGTDPISMGNAEADRLARAAAEGSSGG